MAAESEVAPGIGLAPDVPAPAPARLTRWWRILLRSLAPVILALIAGGLLLLALGRDPVQFYVNVWQGGVESGGWQNSAVLMTPLLLIALGLIVVFRAGIWNLGYDGQYLLAAALVAGFGPNLLQTWPAPVAYALLFLIAGSAGALWTIIPAVLKAWYETNEIITTLMMSFIGVGIANILVKGPFQDRAVNIPQTRTIPFAKLLPNLAGTRVNLGVLVALGAVPIVYYLLTRTSFGLRLEVLGANPRAARHVGISLRRVIVTTFVWSGFLIGLAAALDILGLWAYVRANWNPGYGDTVIPFVFLARLNPLVIVPFVAFYAVLSTGGDLAAQQANLPTDFLLVLVALILLFMTVIEYLGRRRDLGHSYLTPGLREALRRPLMRRRPAP
ncbi:MAG TPA: ABC transporter permease [Streptosporangiaceae bacterium]